MTGFALWLNTICSGFDQSITTAVHELYSLNGAFFTPFMKLISLPGNGGGILLILLALTLLMMKKTRRYGTGMALGMIIGAILVNVFLKTAVARPRPYLDEAGIYYQFWKLVGMRTESDMSFPSGHTNIIFAALIPLWLTLRAAGKKFGWILPIYCVFMMISRIYLCVHYPTDVIGGMLTGIISGVAGYILAKKIPEGWYKWPNAKQQSNQ